MRLGLPAAQRVSVSALVMSSPEADEVLFAYITVAPHAVSLVLIRMDNGVQ